MNEKYNLIVAFDNDVKSKAGINAVKNIANSIGKPINYLKLNNCKDITELYSINKTSLLNNKNVEFKIMKPTNIKVVSNSFQIKTINATELQKIKFDEDIWYIDKIIKPGLIIISGRPKDGKSRLALYMSVCIAKGIPFMKKYFTKRAGVFYITYEENFRLIQKRLNKMLQGSNFPKNLNFPYVIKKINGKKIPQVNFQKFDEGGLQNLESLIKENRNYKVIIFDNVGKAFAERMNKRSYEEDYMTLAPLQELANKYDVCLIGLHHNRKQSANNPIDEMMGSSSLSAVADTLVNLRKINATDLEVHITGRDIEQRTISIRVNNNDNTWKEITRSKNLSLTPDQEKVYSHFAKSKNLHFQTKVIERITELPKSRVSIILKTLKRKGLIENTKYGVYKLVA